MSKSKTETVKKAMAELEAETPIVEMPTQSVEHTPDLVEPVESTETLAPEPALKQCVIEEGPIVIGRNTLPNYMINSFLLKKWFEKDQKVEPSECRAKITEAIQAYYDVVIPDKMPRVNGKALNAKIVEQAAEIEKSKKVTETLRAEIEALTAQLPSER